MHEFDQDTAIEPVGDDRFIAQVSPRWAVGGRPNGGYLMSIGVRAMGQVMPQLDPLTVTAHFSRQAEPGPSTIEVDLIRKGRRVSFGHCRMLHEGSEYLRMTSAFTDLSKSTGMTRLTASPPDLPPLDECISPDPGAMDVSIFDRFDMRLDPRCAGWLRGEASGRGEMAAWIRFADGREPDLLSLIQVVDALPPAVFELGPVDPVPTVELTTHLRAHPAPGWLRAVMRTRNVIDGFLEEEAEVWDSSDRLVAQARQLAIHVGGQ